MPRERRVSPGRTLIAVAVILAVAAVAGLEAPEWYRRVWHPLRYEQAIEDNARSNGLDPYLVAAVINVESGFEPEIVSKRGAVGLMQVLPETGREVARETRLPERVTTETLKRPGTSIRVGTRYLGSLVKEAGDVEVALAAYNAGVVNATRWKGLGRKQGRPFREMVDFPETKRYIREVLTQRETYARLYPRKSWGTPKP